MIQIAVGSHQKLWRPGDNETVLFKCQKKRTVNLEV
jgi:hypothetical protein